MNVRAAAAIVMTIVLLAGTTAPSALFVVYRSAWKLSTADLGIVFAVYIGSLVPALLLLGGMADRIGRRAAIAIGLGFAMAGLTACFVAGDRTYLIAARLLQGIGVGIAVGGVAAALAETHRGTVPAAAWTGAASNAGLLFGALITAVAFDLGAGLHGSYLPMLVITLACAALLGLFSGRTSDARRGLVPEEPLPPRTVARTLAFVLPATFVSLSAFSLFLSMVPAFLESRLHAHDPLVGALVIAALQTASIVATLRLGGAEPGRAAVFASATIVVGLALLIAGTSAQGPLAWILVAVATIVVGVSGGIGFGSAFSLAARVARGQRARVFSRVYVATYLGFGLPGLAVGLIAARTSLTIGFIVTTAFLAATTALLPLLRARIEPVPAPGGFPGNP